MNRSAEDRFDSDGFVDDVLEWLADQKRSRRWLAIEADLDLSALLQVLRKDRAVSLLVACALTDLCDLSLDDYRCVS